MSNLKNIFEDCKLKVQHFEQVRGGDINEAYCVISATGKFFLKINERNAFPFMFAKEAKGLDLLRRYCPLTIPRVIKTGYADDKQYLLLEWLEKGDTQKDMWEKFGEGLALLHKQPQQYFGLDDDNYIGSLEQVNKKQSEWHLFYSVCRIMPLVRKLFDDGRYFSTDIAHAESLCLKLKNIFPVEPASLLHGDLWAGNYLVGASGHAAIFDPAVYCGHREMDIGMTRLFGGFDKRFYQAYNDTYPLEKHWEKRLKLTQLYPLLVHAVLFGGHYVLQSKETLKIFS